MEENSDSTSWVLVNDVDNADEAITLVSLTSSGDSDQDSDGSITILKDHSSDSCSEEDFQQTKSSLEGSSLTCNFNSHMGTQIEDIVETQEESHQTDESDCNSDEVDYLEEQIELITRQQLRLKNADSSREGTGIKIGVGLLMSFLAFMTSHVVSQYSQSEYNIMSANEEYLGPDVIPTYTLIDLCIFKQFSKGRYTEQAVQKCVNKKLRKLNMEELAENSPSYLHMQKRIVELQDEFINTEDFNNNKVTYKSEKKEKSFDKKKNAPKHQKGEFNNKISFTSKDQLKAVKEKVKHLWETEKFSKKFRKFEKKLDSNEEWYIKYNPVKDTIEIVNITSLPAEQSRLIKNNQKLLNGQWYFKLYGTSRSDNRHKEQMKEEESQWFFKRGRHRANKRNKAKWYFDYMSGREGTRYAR